MALKEISSEASVVANICPISSSGKKPFGLLMKSAIVMTNVESAPHRTTLRFFRARSR